jgi:hypothetical protein
MLISLLGLAFIFLLSVLNWRKSIYAVLVLLVVEGALRKWAFPEASETIYFLKDVVLIGAYINYYGFAQNMKRPRLRNSLLTIAIFLAAGWCLFQALNPSLGSPLVGLFGLRSYLLYIPLLWLVPALFSSEEELYRFLRNYLLLLIPVGLLGIIQFFSPADSFLNVYAPGETAVATFGTTANARVTGTFSYISGYTAYLLVCFSLLVPMLTIAQAPRWRLLTTVELLLVVVNGFMNGARGLILAGILYLLGYFLVKGLTQTASMIRLLKQFTAPILAVAIAAILWFRPAIDAFWQRTTANQDILRRITDSFLEPVQFLQYKELDGFGTGATHQATPALRRILGLPAGEAIPTFYEGEMGRITLEMGPLGFLFWYGLRLVLILLLWQVYRQLTRPWLKELALSIFLLQLVQLNGHLVFHHTFSFYYWFLSGFIFLLPQLEQATHQATQHPMEPFYVPSPHRPDPSHG